MKEYFIKLSFEEGPEYFVRYKAEKNLVDEIEDAITNFDDLDLLDFELFIKKIMDSFNVEWAFQSYAELYI